MWSSAAVLDMVGCRGAAAILRFPKTQTASMLRPALGPFLIFDHVAIAIGQQGRNRLSL